MTSNPKIPIIGIGDDGLDAVPAGVRDRITSAEVLLGDERTLSLVPPRGEQRVVIGASLDAAVEQLASAQGKTAAVLVYGDPLYYGLARFLCERLGKECFEIVPHVSSMQLAFARVMESWEDAYLTNLADHTLETVLERIRVAEKVGLFTTDQCGPGDVARALLDRGIDYFTVYVCENLGSRDERVTRGSLAEISGQSFDPLNVLILVRHADAPDRPQEAIGRRLFGNPDDAFLQSTPKQGLLTPSEVRAIALAQLDIGAGSIVWDIGAGSGSVSIEAAQLASGGSVFAIEMDAEDHALIQENAERFGIPNVTAVLGKAPEAWAALPDPDCIFIEGSGREITRVAELAMDRLRSRGRLVANVGSIDNLTELRQALLKKTKQVHVWMINVARGTDQLDRLRFDALSPTFLIAAHT